MTKKPQPDEHDKGNPSSSTKLENDSPLGTELPAELLELIPEEKREKASLLIQASFSHYFQGPIPPPEVIKGYEKVLPGSANRIIAMAEKEQDYRHQFSSIIVKSNVFTERLGLGAAFTLALVLSVGSIGLIYNDKNIEGLAIFIVEIVTLAGLFLYRQNRQEKRREEE